MFEGGGAKLLIDTGARHVDSVQAGYVGWGGYNATPSWMAFLICKKFARNVITLSRQGLHFAMLS